MANISLETTAVTLEDLLSLKSDARVEIINGVMVEMAPVGGLHHVVAGNIYTPFKMAVDASDLGAVFMDGLLYLMNEKDRYLRGSFVPDVSFIRRQNIPADWNILLPFPGVPTLAVEVVSPNDSAEDLQTKVHTYLEKGTEQVWIAYPVTRQLYQHQGKTVRLYAGSEQVDTENLFPDLVLTLDMIFNLPSWAEKLYQE